MKAIVKVVVPVALAFAAVGAQAGGTIETDYPLNLQSSASMQPAGAASGELHLIQSEYEGVRETAAGSGRMSRTDAPAASGSTPGSAFEKGVAELGYFA